MRLTKNDLIKTIFSKMFLVLIIFSVIGTIDNLIVNGANELLLLINTGVLFGLLAKDIFWLRNGLSLISNNYLGTTELDYVDAFFISFKKLGLSLLIIFVTWVSIKVFSVFEGNDILLYFVAIPGQVFTLWYSLIAIVTIDLSLIRQLITGEESLVKSHYHNQKLFRKGLNRYYVGITIILLITGVALFAVGKVPIISLPTNIAMNFSIALMMNLGSIAIMIVFVTAAVRKLDVFQNDPNPE